MPVFIYESSKGGDALGVKLTDGNIVARFDSSGRRRIGTTTAPTVVVGAGAGSSATATVAGTDEHGVITVTTGASGAGAGTLATLTFYGAYNTAPTVSVGFGDQYSAAAEVYYTSTATAVVIKAAATPASSQALKITYHAVGGA